MEFEKSRQVLAAKRKNFVKQGKGCKPQATRALTDDEENTLFVTGQFGDSSPSALQRTMWWFLSMHFGFRARDESRKLCWGDVELQNDPEDNREMYVCMYVKLYFNTLTSTIIFNWFPRRAYTHKELMLIICRTTYVRIPPLKFYHLPPKPPPPKQAPTHPHTNYPLPAHNLYCPPIIWSWRN